MEREPEALPGSAASSSPCLFAPISLSGPLEELRATLEKKVKMYESLGDEENARRVEKAHDLAREKLAALLDAPRSGGASRTSPGCEPCSPPPAAGGGDGS